VKKINNAPKQSKNTLSKDVFDVVIVGAGVVGCAIARRFALAGAKVAIVEKGVDILDGASKANSAILHTAFDAPPNSLEHACIRSGYDEYHEIYQKMGLPLENTGAFVVAWNEEELAGLEKILEQAHRNGVVDAQIISASMLHKKEPNLASHALGAIEVPKESIIDPWSAPHAYLLQAIENGAQLFRSCEVTGGEFERDEWQLETSRGSLRCQHVINSAGLYGDRLDHALLGHSQFQIKPRKGQFVVFDKVAAELLTGIILPVPSDHTKGIVVFRTVFGNLVVGPTAEEQDSRSDASTDEETLRMLIASGIDKVPELKNIPVTAIYAGIRPATEYKDYQIESHADKNWITVGGIRSTGLSAALGIAQYVFKLYSDTGKQHIPCDSPITPQMPMLAERGERDWRNKQHGKIVCHCELVTEREVANALTGCLAAQSLQGLKRRTRVTMGRCQGFYCSARLAELTQGHFKIPLAENIDDD